MELSKSFNKTVNNVYKNQHFVTILTLLIALYVSFAAPKLPDVIVNLFNNDFMKLGICFLIAYTSSNNLKLSLMITVLFVFTTGLITQRQIENFMLREHFEHCSSHKKDDEDTFFGGCPSHKKEEEEDTFFGGCSGNTEEEEKKY